MTSACPPLSDKEVAIDQPLLHVMVVPSPACREWVTQTERTVPGSPYPLVLDHNPDTSPGELDWQHPDAQAQPVRSDSAKLHFYLPSFTC